MRKTYQTPTVCMEQTQCCMLMAASNVNIFDKPADKDQEALSRDLFGEDIWDDD